jgi:hypothetical protein
MKINYSIFALILVFSVTAFGCPGEVFSRRLNPDGLPGGKVSTTAVVESEVYISEHAMVCGKSHVKNNVIVSGRAIVTGSSSIQGYVHVEDDAIIGGESTVIGEETFPTRVSGKSKVFGQAYVGVGTKVHGSASVGGKVRVINSHIFGNAELCDDIMLKNVTVEDSSYCGNEPKIDSSLRLVNYKVAEVNKNSRNIIFESKKTIISRKPGRTIIKINDTEYFPSTRGNQVILPGTHLTEGINTVQLFSEDTKGQKFKSEEYELLVSNEYKEVSLSQADEESYLTRVDLWRGEELYRTESYVDNGKLRYLYLPGIFSRIDFLAIGNDALYFMKWRINDISPSPIEPVELLPRQNDSITLSETLEGWSGDFSNVAIQKLDSAATKLTFNEERVYVFTKKIRVQPHSKIISFQIEQQVAESADSGNAMVAFIPLRQDLLNGDVPFIQESFFTNYQQLKWINTSGEPYEAIVLLTFSPLFNSKNSASTNIITPIDTSGITANLYNVGVVNKVATHIPLLSTTGTVNMFESEQAINCAQLVAIDNGQENRRYEVTSRNLDFISANWQLGVTNNSLNLQKVKKNRIYGDLIGFTAQHLPLLDTIKFRLIEPVTGEVVAESNIASCYKKKLRSVISSGGTGFSFQNYRNHALMYPLMEFNFDSYLMGSVLPLDDLEIQMFIPERRNASGQIEVAERVIHITSKRIVTPLLIDTQRYATSRIEGYESSQKNFARSPGDKWILPSYMTEVEEMLSVSRNSFWFVNDISMLNGAGFSHKGHNTAREIDIVYGTTDVPNESGYDFRNISSSAGWRNALDRIEEFLATINYYFIEEILISFDKTLALTNKHKEVALRFHNRCMETNWSPMNNKIYVNLDTEKEMYSLLRDVPPHENHLHVTLTKPDALGFPSIRKFNNNLNSDFVGDLIFSFKPGNKLKISLVDKPEYVNKTVYWRFQSSDNFTDTEMTLCAGNTRQLIDTTFGKFSSVGCSTIPETGKERRFIYAMLVDNDTGECIPIDNGDTDFLEIDLP